MMNQPHKVVRRAPGRPRIDPNGEGAQVRIRITAAIYDEIYQLAAEEGLDVPSMIRSLIGRGLLLDRRAVSRRPS